MNIATLFHPAVARWFAKTFAAPTPAQVDAWPAIQSGKHVLIAAPTGSGKTLAAFLAAIDELVREGAQWGLPDETRVLYVSPLKALSNDINRNLEAPLAGIRSELAADTIRDVDIRTWVRTGDTPQYERTQMHRKPPHIVVTTPESLYILLGSTSGRKMLATVRTVIVDEIHAVAGNKRGSHLALSLERLDALTAHRLMRIGLSATQKPIDEVARFLVGMRHQSEAGIDCTIIDSGHVRHRDLQLELPPSPLEAVMSGEVWTQVYDRLAQLIEAHRTTLVFVNTRRHAERVARHLAERVGSSLVAAHHGSLAKELRFKAEQHLKAGELKVLVATASLELGIDIGDVDLVCQLGTPRSINAFLQRVGRSGHAVGGTPKGRLFPLSRDDLVECTALLDSIRRGELDRLVVPQNALDVLSQQIVAEAASRDCGEAELYDLMRSAYPYRSLKREAFDDIVRMLAEGFTTRRGRRGALVYHDAVNHIIRGRKGARLTAVTSGGAIPDTADYQVMLEPEGQLIGTVNEDFAVESLQGDVFQLGNASYRILRVERSVVRVEDAHGEAPSIPFWLGEAPGRTDELSQAVSRLRNDVQTRLAAGSSDDAFEYLTGQVGISEAAALQLVDYLAAAHAALGCLPTQDTIVFERFFDEAGGMQLVIHSPFGSRINRAWGLALRKRFCRTFNFELQAAATEDTIILSLTTAHSFELAEVARYLHPNTARDILIQALLAAPMFTTRWRWAASIALALPRFRGGKKVPPQLARMNAEDLLASVFPDQVACGENIVGDIVVPDHPLVQQTVRDCLEEAMDVEGFERLLRRVLSGEIRVEARDLTEPSPLALEVLSARPYAYLDDAPLEERRTQAVMSRRWMDPNSASDIGKLDPDAIAKVRDEAWPDATTPDELHDALLWLTFMTQEEVERNPAWPALMERLLTERRVTRMKTGAGTLYLATERQAMFSAALPEGAFDPVLPIPSTHQRAWSQEDALIAIVRGRLEGLGPTTAAAIAQSCGLSIRDVDAALLALEAEGSAMRGNFVPGFDPASDTQWCDRRLLARIHRYTIKRLRAEIEPVQARDFLRFLFDWQRVTPGTRMQGPDSIGAVLGQLEGFDAPASAWETEILPSRIEEYEPAWLDEQCLAGRIVWTRLANRNGDSERGAAPVRSTPIALLARRNVRLWSTFSTLSESPQLTSKAERAAEFIRMHGASFFDEIVEGSGLLPNQVEEALAELVALGVVNSDSFGGLRALLVPSDRRRSAGNARRRRRIAIYGMQDAGRWSMVRRAHPSQAGGLQDDRAKESVTRATSSSPSRDPEALEHVCRTLLRRWGVVFWKLLEREADWLPPWREMLMCLRRLEARGEVRGGRFVSGFSGEQFALPEAIGPLREARRKAHSGELISLSGADPLNLVGVITPGARVPALTGNRVLYRDGVPIAVYVAGEVRFLEELETTERWAAQNGLLRRKVPEGLGDLA
jgi:ATP-dependent Lhr-like helicase